MYKKINKIICMVIIFTLLFNFIAEVKVKAEVITLTLLGKIVFGALAVACGYTILKKADFNSLYNEYMKFKGNTLNFNEYAKGLFMASILTSKFAFDATSEHVKSVTDYFSNLGLKDGYNKVNYKTNSLPYYEAFEITGFKGKVTKKGNTRSNNLFIMGDGLVIGTYESTSWLNITVNGIHIHNMPKGKNGIHLGKSVNIEFPYFRIEEVKNQYGQLVELIVSYKVRYLVEQSYDGSSLEWKEYEVINRKISVTESIRDYMQNSGIEYPDYVDIFGSNEAIHNGHSICADLKNPTLGLSVSEGIAQKHGDTMVYNGDVEALINDLAEAGVLEGVLEWQLGKTREAFIPLPTIIPEVNTETNTITWPATDVINPSIPDVQNPDIPIVWQDLFKSGTKTIDFTPFMEIGFADRFPFCVPFDLVKSIETLKAPPKAPRWVANIKGVDLVIDLSQFEHLAAIVRWFMLLIYIVVLIMISRRMIGGE